MSEPFTVEAVAGERLDVALGADQRVGSRAAAQKLIDAGAVLVDGVPRAKRHMLRGGESIEVRPPEPPAPDVAITLGALGLVLISLSPAPAGDEAKPKPGPG